MMDDEEALAGLCAALAGLHRGAAGSPPEPLVLVHGGGKDINRHLAWLGEEPVFKDGMRSEERRVGKECRSRWSPYH